MKNDEIKTEILKVAESEFLKHGYLNTSMRDIAKKVSLTTGSLYNRFKNKEEIFDELVKEGSSKLLSFFISEKDRFSNQSFDKQIVLMEDKMDGDYDKFIEIIYEYFTSFKLIICKGQGSKYENYLDSIIDIETTSTLNFIKSVNKESNLNIDINQNVIHILASALFKGIFEIVEHDMLKEEALEYERTITSFFTAGWKKILNI